jgi:folate-binding protein YgfZ
MNTITDQYPMIAAGAGWLDRSDRGRLRIEGRDAVAFLHALLTNDLTDMQAGAGRYAAYLTPQGRMIADMRVFHRGDHLLMDVAPGVAAGLAARMDALVFAEDVRVSNVSAAFGGVTVFGGAAADEAARALAIDAATLRGLPVLSQAAAPGHALAVRADDVDLPVFDVLVPVGDCAALVGRLSQAGVVAASRELFDALRIEAGRPAFGVDMTTDTIPLEAGLLARTISTTKGCYVGQEVIVRVLHRGHGRVARRLVKLVLDPSARMPPAAGTPLTAGRGEVGRITSAAFSPRLDRVVALGYVQRDVAEAGGQVMAGTLAGEIAGFAG